jgi:hypothetical protein
MTIQLAPVAEDLDFILASALVSRLKSAYQITLQAQEGNNADDYGALVNIPTYNKALQDKITEIQAAGRTATIIAYVDTHKLLPSGFTTADAQSFANAFDLLAADIESNAALFLLSINPTTKRSQFVTPVSQGVKDTISSRLIAVLAEVS